MDDSLHLLVAALLKLVLREPQFAAALKPEQKVSAPALHRAPQREIAQAVCGAPCGARAYYAPERGVFIDDSLDVENDMFARSVLFHELVHHAQHALNRYGQYDPCERNYRREREAFVLQNMFLIENQSPARVGNAAKVLCDGAPLASDAPQETDD
jgi:hypothetical protein